MTVPLHRLQFGFGPANSIDIECVKGTGEHFGNPPPIPHLTACERELAPDEFTSRGVPAICWRADTPVLFEPLQLRENTDYFIDVTLPIPKSEAERYSKVNAAWPFSDRVRAVFKSDPPRRWKEPDANSVVVTGQLRLRNHAGILDLRTEYGSTLRIEVVCRKIGYLAEFQTLLSEVAEYLAELLLQYDSPVSSVFDLTDARKANLAGVLFQMRYVMAEENLPLAIEEVLSQIHATLVTETRMQAISEVEEANAELLAETLDTSLLETGGPLAGLFRGYTPRELPVTEVSELIDTPENRYLKYFLEECALLAGWLSASLRDQGKSAAAREAENWAQRLQELLADNAWRSVGVMRQFPANSQVLLKRRGYREVLRFDLALRLSLTLPWSNSEKLAEGLTGDIRPVSELYEYWCFFQLRRILSELCIEELRGNGSFLVFTDDGLQVRLAKGKRSRVLFLYRKDEVTTINVALYYNRKFKRPARNLTAWEGSYTAFFDPDYSVVITVTRDGTTIKHWLHFDAKYRLEQTDLNNMLFDSAGVIATDEGDDESGYAQEISRIYRREDLFKMHTYRDGILSTRGAYILFPGDGTGLRSRGEHPNFFVRHPSAFEGAGTHTFPSVGAFDLCPGRDLTQLPAIRTFLNGVLEAVASNKLYKEEYGLFEQTASLHGES